MASSSRAVSARARQVTDDCDIVDDVPEMLQTAALIPSRSATHDRETARALSREQWVANWRVRVWRSYTIPKIDVLVSGTYQNQPGAQLAANHRRPTPPAVDDARTRVHRRAGRPSLQPRPGRRGVHRAAEPDRLPRREAVPASTARAQASTSTSTTSPTPTRCSPRTRHYGAAWRTPQSILLPRLFKLSAQFDF